MIGAAGDVTVTVAVPKILPLVARTVLLKVPVAPPAVNSPVAALMVPPPAVTDHTGVMATTLPVASLPTAVYCWVVLIGSVTGFGVTVMVASGPATTVTVADAAIPRQVATTVLVTPATGPAVKRPVLGLMEPPPVTDQTMAPGLGVTLAPVKSVPAAVNCTVPFGATVVGFGETTSVSNLPGSVLSFLHAVADTPANARAMIIRAARARVMCVRTFGLFLNDFIELS